MKLIAGLRRVAAPLAVILGAALLGPALKPAPATAAASPLRQIVRIEGTTTVDNQILLSLGFDIAAARPGEWTDVLAAPGDTDRLRALGYPSTPRGAPVTAIPSQYHDYNELVAALQQYATNYPQIARLEDIGDGWGKIYNDADYVPHEIWALKISDNVQIDEAEPALLYTGVHHAREPVTLEICLGVADELLTKYNTDPAIRRFVDEHETWIVPLANPDGHYCVTNLNYTDWRKNIRDNDGNGQITAPGWWWYPDGVDNNRNYAWHWGGLGSDADPNAETYRGPSAFSEPENQALRDLALREDFVFSIDYHSYGELVLYPYGYDNTTNAPDEQFLIPIATTLRDRIGGNYVAEQANQLYPAAGNSQDWHYGEYNCYAFIIETGTEFIPPGTTIPAIVTPNVRGAMYLQERVDGSGVRGIVRINGAPGFASVLLVGVDNPSLNHARTSHPVTGDYYRITGSGNRTLRFSTPGFQDQEFTVNVPAAGYVSLDVDFGIAQDVAAGDPSRALSLDLAPNPTRGGVGLTYRLPAGASCGRLTIYEPSGRVIEERKLAAGAGSTAWAGRNTAGQPASSGIYFVRIEAAGVDAVRKVVLLP